MSKNDEQIKIENLSKIYNEGKDNALVAIKEASLSIKKGESIAVLGKSGSGKSTLMHIMSLLDSPSLGNIFIEGQDFSTPGQENEDILRSRAFGFVFQQFFLNPHQTVLENVELPLIIQGVSKKEREERAIEIIKRVDLEDKIKERAINLSGGQKQRVAIARALVNEPLIIFADEPTGNLDTTTGEQIIKLLFQFNKEKNITLIIVTHDQEIARECERQIVISDGVIVKS